MANAQLIPSGKRPTVRPPRSTRILARELIETAVLMIIVFLVVNVTARPYSVDGPSMEPGLTTGDRVVVSMLAYDFGSPQRGDVIVFHPPSDPGATYVKRVIGIPGDRISITPTSVIVNGHTLKEPYITLLDPNTPANASVLPTVTLHANQYFVMGDDRQDSIDSRVFGYVPRTNIIGKAEFVYWPLPGLRGISTYSNVFSGVGH
ncbi:MAG TPA: signal peptidase I [Ktedonobacterales bacterium]